MLVLARSIVKCTPFLNLTHIKMSIRNTKPVIPKLVTDNLSKQPQQFDADFAQYLQQEQIMNPINEYDQILPGLYRTYPSLEAEDELDYSLRSKRHRVAKLKRAKRKDGKKTHIQNN